MTLNDLPKEIVIDEITYTLKGEFSNDEPLGKMYFAGYYPPEENGLPPFVKSDKAKLYLISVGGFGSIFNTPEETLVDEACKDMLERLQGARIHYPSIDEALKEKLL